MTEAPTAVLVVDDDQAIQTLMGLVLRREGYSVDAAEDGAAALRMIRLTEYGAIILDLMMPNVNGFEVLREFRALRPDLLDRTIVCTAASERSLELLDDKSVFRVIRKPFDLSKLTRIISDCVAQGAART